MNAKIGWGEFSGKDEILRIYLAYIYIWLCVYLVFVTRAVISLNFDFSYEIQLEEDCRRKGLGKFLMQILELLAYK